MPGQRLSGLFVVLGLLLAGLTSDPAAPQAKADPPAAAGNWPGFRGANAAGTADGYRLPTTWNAAAGENIRWKIAIPGRAHSSPIIWGDRLFLTTAVSSEGEKPFRPGIYDDVGSSGNKARHSWRLFAFDKRTGEKLWESIAHEGVPRADNHIKASQANSTPATDGKHLVAMLGSEGLFCYDLDGRLRWRRDLGVLDVGWYSAQWGHASSPILWQNLVIVQVDRNRDAFIAAYALADGREVWRSSRDHPLPSWGTPTLVEGEDRLELVANGARRIRAYDPRNGRELWSLAPTSDSIISTPVVGHGLVFVVGGYRPIQPIYAIRPGGAGDISLGESVESSAYVAWKTDRGGTHAPTPLIYGDYLYTTSNGGTLTCYRARSGERLYRRRIGGHGGVFTASPVAGDGKLYLASEEGGIHVVTAGPSYQLLATNPMGEVLLATPAISEGVIYVRSLEHLYGIGEHHSSPR